MKLKESFKNLRSNVNNTFSYLSVYHSFYKRHKAIYRNSNFERSSLTLSERKQYLNYWKDISPHINLKTVEITKSLSGKFNKYIVPEEFFPLYIETKLNDDNVTFLENKSLYNKWFDEGIFPKDYLHKIGNCYYDSEFELIQDAESFIDNNIKDTDLPLIIKPNKDSYGGANIYSVSNKSEIIPILANHSDLVVQEKIQQSELINKFNRDSINSIRVCLYKDYNGIFNVINTSLRMGVDGSLDNVSAGGISCNISLLGVMNEYAVSKQGKKYYSHPNSGFVFKDYQFPLYPELLNTSINIAKNIVGAKLVSIDIVLDSSDQWRCIEINLLGQTIRFAQYAGEPFFGMYTDEIKKLIINSQIEK